MRNGANQHLARTPPLARSRSLALARMRYGRVGNAEQLCRIPVGVINDDGNIFLHLSLMGNVPRRLFASARFGASTGAPCGFAWWPLQKFRSQVSAPPLVRSPPPHQSSAAPARSLAHYVFGGLTPADSNGTRGSLPWFCGRKGDKQGPSRGGKAGMQQAHPPY